MAVRGNRRRLGVDQGFPLSDHADWKGLNRAIDATGATRVIVTHGHVLPLVQWLRERGLEASAMPTQFESGQGAET
jgi:putative mRNA 3-end processing factor